MEEILKNIKNRPKKDWPIIWCQLNAKEYTPNINKSIVHECMSFIEDCVSKEILMWYWNEEFSYLRMKKRKILDKIIA